MNDLDNTANLPVPQESGLPELITPRPNNPYLQAATANNTRRAYQSDVRHFEQWGGALPATPDSIIAYLQQFAQQFNPRTLSRRLIALKHWHNYQGFPDPTQSPFVKKTLKGILHLHGTPEHKAPSLTLAQLEQLGHYLQQRDTLTAWRDNALLQVGFFGAFRRSELVAIRAEDIHLTDKGMTILIPRSKTDQQGQGQSCALPYGGDNLCPVQALRQWLEKAHLQQGPVFRHINRWQQLGENALHPTSVNRILKTHAAQCNLSVADAVSSHSLRRGFATAASQQGASLKAIMRQGRWKEVDTVLGYIEEGNAFEDNAAHVLLHKQSNSPTPR